jgi:hypothetical protein
MATVIDSLIVTLGLDSKDVDAKAPGVRKKLEDLEKGASKTESGVKGIGKASKDTASELTVLSAKLGSFLAVIGGTVAVRAFVKDTIETNTQLYFLSRNLDMSTQKLFAWGAATREVGGSAASIQNFFRSIGVMAGQFAVGQMPQLIPLFARLGIDFREDPDKIMLDLSKRFAGIVQSRGREFAYGFGVSSGIPDDVMNLILQGPDYIAKNQGMNRRFAPTAKEAADAAALKLQLTAMELQFVKIGYDLLERITPALEVFFGWLQKIGDWAQRHETIVAIIAGVAAALAAFVGLAGVLGAVTLAWDALMVAIEAASPVLAVVGIVAALGAAILLLWNDYKVWSDGGRSYFDWGAFADEVHKAGEAFEWLGDKIGNATDAFGKWVMAHGGSAAKEWLKAHGTDLSSQDTSLTSSDAYAVAYQIAKKEGFYDKRSGGFVPNASGSGSHWDSSANGNIPQRAHNPGDIEYGDFAKSHGATGYVLAQGGKKIATFPDDKTGWDAMYALLATKNYVGLSAQNAISRWQTGSILNGVKGASSVPSSMASSSSTSSTHTDNSRVTNIGTINLQNPAGSASVNPSMARGMDWNTLLTQQNAGLMP